MRTTAHHPAVGSPSPSVLSLALVRLPRARLAVPAWLYRTLQVALVLAAIVVWLLGGPTDSSSVQAASVQVSAPCPQGAPHLVEVGCHG